jgi:hypothetical protein
MGLNEEAWQACYSYYKPEDPTDGVSMRRAIDCCRLANKMVEAGVFDHEGEGGF